MNLKSHNSAGASQEVSTGISQVTTEDISNQVYHEAQNNMRLLSNYYKWIFSSFQGLVRGQVAELGVGDGHVISNYINYPEVTSVLAIDFNEILLSRLTSNLPSKKISCLKIDLRQEWTSIPPASCDCVIALDVLEHFEDDQAFVAKVKSILKPGGHAIIKVPAQSCLFSSVDEASGHYRRYDYPELAKLMTDAGFVVSTQEFFNLFGSLLYPFKNGKQKNFSKTFSPWKIKLANVAMPIIAALDFIPGVKGLSLIGVYQLNVEV